jgi:hypothetical protein
MHVLNLHRLPARLTAEQTAQLLGCSLDDVRLLTRKGLLRSLGGTVPANSVKFYPAVEILQLMNDRNFLDRLTRAILTHHRAKNGVAQVTH